MPEQSIIHCPLPMKPLVIPFLMDSYPRLSVQKRPCLMDSYPVQKRKNVSTPVH